MKSKTLIAILLLISSCLAGCAGDDAEEEDQVVEDPVGDAIQQDSETEQQPTANESAPDSEEGEVVYDQDGDGVNDTSDAFPTDANESVDTDSDGIGDNADVDDDGDGVVDTSDAFPLDPSETEDFDGDGIGDNADTDTDGDGVEDSNDSCPMSRDIHALSAGDYFSIMNEYGISMLSLSTAIAPSTNTSAETTQDTFLDWDGDGCWMFEDLDDDGDGMEDGQINATIPEWWLYTPGDNCVIVSNPDQIDTDEDGMGDACDDDDDNDGVADSEDDHPLDSENS